MIIKVNIDKAKNITHDKRRAAREKEFEPLDQVIMKQIPGKDTQAAEAARQAVRDKYVAIQSNIDAAGSVDELKAIIEQEGL